MKAMQLVFANGKESPLYKTSETQETIKVINIDQSRAIRSVSVRSDGGRVFKGIRF